MSRLMERAWPKRYCEPWVKAWEAPEILESAFKLWMCMASAGNQPVPYPTFPAAQPEVIAVTASYKGQLAPYANYGNFVDVIGPGTVPVNYNNRSWVVSGTSPSSAWMSGWAAGMFDT